MINLNDAATHVKMRGFLVPLKIFQVGTPVKTHNDIYFGHITGFSFTEIPNPDDLFKPDRVLQLKVMWMIGQEESNVDFEDIKLL